MEIKSVILAAGKGTRMKSETPKVLHKILDKTLLGYVLDSVKNITNENFVIVGHHAEEVTEFVQKTTILQKPFFKLRSLGQVMLFQWLALILKALTGLF